MGKISKLIAFILIFLNLINSYANMRDVAPEIIIPVVVDDQTSFGLFGWLDFSAYDQYIYPYSVNQNLFKIEAMQGLSGTFFLNYVNMAKPDYTEKQCQFMLISQNLDVSLTVSQVENSFVSCNLTGSYKEQNLMLHVSLKSDSYKKYFLGR